MVRDSWFTRRTMKLTRFERWFMNHHQRAQHVEQAVRALLGHINLLPQPHCLEIGCGQGAVTRLLIEHFGAQAVATDFDPEQVAVAQERPADPDERVAFHIVDARVICPGWINWRRQRCTPAWPKALRTWTTTSVAGVCWWGSWDVARPSLARRSCRRLPPGSTRAGLC